MKFYNKMILQWICSSSPLWTQTCIQVICVHVLSRVIVHLSRCCEIKLGQWPFMTENFFFIILYREKCHSNCHAVYWDWICIRIYRHHHYFHGYKIISITCSAMLSNLALFFSFNVNWTLAVRANEPNDWWTWIFNYLCTVVKRKRKNHFIIVHITFSINLHAYTLKRFHFQ